MHKEDTITIEYIANCALHVCCRSADQNEQADFLIDGIYDCNEFFSPPDQEVEAAAAGETNRYSNMDYLLFTHRHKDHFQGEAIEKYVESNAVKGLYLTEYRGVFYEDPHALPLSEHAGIPHQLALRQEEKYTVRISDRIAFTYLGCEHADPASYEGIIHCCIILEIFGRRILIGADMNNSEANQKLLMTAGPLDMIFVSPIFLGKKAGWDIIQQIKNLQPEQPLQTVMYHLPFPDYDRSSLLPLMHRIVRRHPAEEENLTVLTEKGQTITL